MNVQAPLLARLRGGSHRPLIYGHRGARGDFPENSMEGFRYLAKIGVHAVELDVQNASGGTPVIFHDPHVSGKIARNAQGDWLPDPGPKVLDIPLAQLQALDIGTLQAGTAYQQNFPDQAKMSGVRIPSLDAFCEWLQEAPEFIVNVEIKSHADQVELGDPPDVLATTVIGSVQKHGLDDRVIISSFDWRVLSACKAIAPHITRGYLSYLDRPSPPMQPNIYDGSIWMDNVPYDSATSRLPEVIHSLGGHVWAPFYQDLTKRDLDLAKTLGLIVNVWTVNTPQDIRRMIDLGVDGVITDYPARAQSVVHAFKST
ncbi:MAG: glycerophosphoryl diester phosphodiesterase [Yoonia sp.]|jgi:glycerophosphoryl diester phosphodiesterase